MSEVAPPFVLLIEDSAGDAALIREYLKAHGPFRVEHAETMKAAVAGPESTGVDAVLLDMNLPDSQGLANVAAVRRRFPHAAIAVLTGRNEASLAAAAVRGYAQDYIVKGELKGAELAAAVRRAIERKRGEEIGRLREREALQKEFIANVSHEFRTPIAAIKGAVETLQLGVVDPAQNEEFLSIIARHTERLAKLVEDVLLVSALDSQRPPEVAAVSLRPAVDRCLSDLAALAAKRDVRIKTAVPADLKVRADAGHLDQVLENLCANAIEYNKPGGEVAVTASSDGFEAVLSVKDDGMGIPEAELPLIFDRFHRTAKARERKLGGTGLGLMIVKRLINAQGGRVWAESVEGRGSTFRVALPLA